MKSRFSALMAASVAFSMVAALPAHAQLKAVANTTGLSAHTSVVTFSELYFGGGTPITMEFLTQGISLTSALAYDTQGSPSWPGIAGDYLGTTAMADPFSIFFGGPVSGAAFGLATNPTYSTFTALLAGNVVASFTSPTSYDGSQPSYFGFEADGYGTFDEIQVQVNSSAAILDNVQINSAIATPEPASIILLGTGLVGVFGVARRRMTRIV